MDLSTQASIRVFGPALPDAVELMSPPIAVLLPRMSRTDGQTDTFYINIIDYQTT